MESEYHQRINPIDSNNPYNPENFAESSRVLFNSSPLRVFSIFISMSEIGIVVNGKNIQML